MSSPDTEKQLRRTRVAFHGVAGAALAVTVFLAWSILIRPVETQQYLALQRMGQLETTLAASDSIHAEYASLSRRLADAREQESALQTRIPDDPSEEGFLALASELATQTGLTIKDYRPGESTEMASCSAMDVELIAEGGYASICRFLDGVAKLPRLSSIRGLHIDATKSGTAYVVKISVLLYYGAVAKPEKSSRGASNA
jgi:Tfp pilus assembly protein PilO